MIIWTNGCFDILHRGHIELFKYAQSLGDKLIVGVDSDEKVTLDKGPGRPINTLKDRIFLVQSIKYVDKVISFDSTEGLKNTIKLINPDIMVIGSDWRDKDVIGQEYTKELKFFNRVGDYSTTKLLKGVKNQND